jgi:carbohydrate-selective porin OprB
MAYFGDTARTAIPGLEQSERTFEINYRAPINGWLTLSPDVQFVVDPYGNPDLANDVILYVRSEVTL